MTEERNTTDQTPMVPRNEKSKVRKRPQLPTNMGDYAFDPTGKNLTYDSISAKRGFTPTAPVITPPFVSKDPDTSPVMKIADNTVAGEPAPRVSYTTHPDEMLKMKQLVDLLTNAISCNGGRNNFCLSTTGAEWNGNNGRPVTSRTIDIGTTAAGIPVVAGLFRTGISFTVPDRWIAVVTHAANGLENQAAFIDVNWRMRIGDRVVGPSSSNLFSALDPNPTPIDGSVRNQIGLMTSPTALAVNLIVNQLETFTFEAISLGAAHVGQMRIMGYMYPVQKESSDGSFSQFHSA